MAKVVIIKLPGASYLHISANNTSSRHYVFAIQHH